MYVAANKQHHWLHFSRFTSSKIVYEIV